MKDTLTEAEYAQKAAALWKKFTPEQKTAVRFGMVPANIAHQAAHDGYSDTRRLAVALMACAKTTGGMIA